MDGYTVISGHVHFRDPEQGAEGLRVEVWNAKGDRCVGEAWTDRMGSFRVQLHAADIAANPEAPHFRLSPHAEHAEINLKKTPDGSFHVDIAIRPHGAGPIESSPGTMVLLSRFASGLWTA